jgi:glyoxylase-like metal-dependent hydrolase (beta-lactamase superfamily II)
VQIGEVEVVVITDSLGPFLFPAGRIFPTVSEAEWTNMRQRYPSAFSAHDVLMAHVSCCLIRSRERTILLDTGVGLRDAPNSGLQGDLMRQIELERLNPDDIDTVVFSHLDADHVGGSIRGEGLNSKPMFPNARHIASGIDWKICISQPDSGVSKRFKATQVLPLHTWKMLTLVTGEVELAEGIRLIPTQGHTPGHMSVWIESQGESILLAADAFYHPLQIPEPAHSVLLDMDPSVASFTRMRLLELIESKRAYLCACHFPLPGIGRLTRDEMTLYWKPLNGV